MQCSGDLNADLCDRRMNNGVRVCLVQGDSYNSKERQKERRDEWAGLVGWIMELDEMLSLSLAVCAHPTTPLLRALQMICYTLELSGHGAVWFVLVGLVFVLWWCTGEQILWTYAINLLYILIIDIIMVAPIKLFFRRSRPKMNRGHIPLSVSSVDVYAFPSGHASRCVAIAAFFCYMPPFYLWTHLWYVWALIMSLSRILLGRHHIGDVVAGMAAGLVVFETARWTFLLVPS